MGPNQVHIDVTLHWSESPALFKFTWAGSMQVPHLMGPNQVLIDVSLAASLVCLANGHITLD